MKGSRLAWLAASTMALACPASAIQLFTQQQQVEALAQRLPVEDPLAIFAAVFAALPERVEVHPSENYYYFRFASAGRWYGGNIRLEPGPRDRGQAHFAYAPLLEPGAIHYRLLGAEDGLTIDRIAPLLYRLRFRGKQVDFHLEALPQHPPTALHLADWEEFIARSEDESGLRFLLMYNRAYRHFYWVLDSEQLFDIPLQEIGDELFEHRDSGFVFYRDPTDQRFVLAGVARASVAANDYHDGPFDQLADNVIEQTPFSQRLREAYIETRGRVDDHGRFPSGARVAIIPYLSYDEPQQVAAYLRRCRQRYRERAGFYFCLFRDQTRIYADGIHAGEETTR